MPGTWLLMWNENQWSDNIDEVGDSYGLAFESIKKGIKYRTIWNVPYKINEGDHIYIFKTYKERGIVASGLASSNSLKIADKKYRIYVTIDRMLSIEDRLTSEILDVRYNNWFSNGKSNGGGCEIKQKYVNLVELKTLWDDRCKDKCEIATQDPDSFDDIYKYACKKIKDECDSLKLAQLEECSESISVRKNGRVFIKCYNINDNYEQNKMTIGLQYFNEVQPKEIKGCSFKGSCHGHNTGDDFELYPYVSKTHFDYVFEKFVMPYMDKLAKAKTLTPIGKPGDKDNMTKELETEILDLLETNHNIVLHGAPGTGKTYLAKDIAALMNATEEERESFDDDDEKIRIKEKYKRYSKLVQFHPSYDYTDFVEGLRSYEIKTEKGTEIGFHREDGVFKKFCKEALRQAILDGAIEYLPIDESPAVFQDGEHSESQERLQDGYYRYKGSEFRSGLDDFIEDFWKVLKSNNIKTWRINKDKLKCRFVFIIDEINRGNMSKIFGELFFSIDPGYRGIEGRVETQYQNLVDSNENENDPFHSKWGGFFVPDNVYIIGTMNDIDRSVECMDFAFRRRFVFKEILANENNDWLTAHLDDAGIAKDVMKALNDKIYKPKSETDSSPSDDCIKVLNSDYHIGASYFGKLKDLGNDYVKLWMYSLEPLLKEYLRGNVKQQELLDVLKNAYDEARKIKKSGGPKATDNEQKNE